MRENNLDSLFRYAYDKGFFNGSWLYKKKGVIVSQGGLGIAAPEGSAPLNVDSMFDVASISKQFTAAAIMLLRDRGRLSLDDPLEKYLPKLPYPGICIRNLLNHTSGLPVGSDWMADFLQTGQRLPGNYVTEEMLCSAGLPRQFEPGTQWAYCNTGYSVLALVVERASGRPFADFLREELFAPCGMARTAVIHVHRDGRVPENFAHGMFLEEGRYVLTQHSEKERYAALFDGMEGDGAVKTTARDLLLWDEALRREAVLPMATQREMYTATRLKDGSSYPYGFGWELSEDGKQVTHYGRWAGYHGVFSRLLEEDSMVVALCNQMGCDTMARSDTLDAAVQLLRTGSAPLPRTLDEKADPAAAGQAFTGLHGSYRLRQAGVEELFDDDLTVYGEEGRLMLRLVFMDTVFDTQLVPIEPGFFIAREGLFEVWFKENTLRTRQFDKDFIFVREESGR